MDGAALTGDFRVRIVWPAWDEGWKLVQKYKDGMAIRRHLLKLRYWPPAH